MPNLFPLGQLVATPGALQAFTEAAESPLDYLLRHVQGDWGDLDRDDVHENWLSVENGWRILSAYRLKNGEKIWIITEADRSSTCVMLPADY